MDDRLPSVVVREATRDDLLRVVELIHLGAVGGPAGPAPIELTPAYLRAFARFDASEDATVMVAEVEGVVVGTFSLTILPNLSNGGRDVAQIESVHVAESMRGRGVGEAMLRRAIAESKSRGCFRMQLSSNKERVDAHRFYRRLGFIASHEGMKLAL
jgi:ribosomal protein S18 acetylase RimI-like enzyme